jgi:hypothetical protein
MTWAPVLARMPADRQTAMWVALARVFEAMAHDDALDVMNLLIKHPADACRERT